MSGPSPIDLTRYDMRRKLALLTGKQMCRCRIEIEKLIRRAFVRLRRRWLKR